jgi:signal transduction histidine kinase
MFKPEPVPLRLLVERSVKQLRPLAGGREFRVKVGPDVVAMADAERVDEMLRNVIQNALKYTPAGSPIDIYAHDDADAVKLAVRDYGPGIPAHEIDHVFERFERGSRSASDTSGMGPGLYLVRLLVEARGGTVEIELPAGGGTEIVFSLRRASADL